MPDASDADATERPPPGGVPPTDTSGWLRPSLPLAVCVLLVSAISWIRVPLLPTMGEDLEMSASTLGWVVTAFGVGRLMMDMPAGRLVDRVAPLKLFAVSALAMAVASLGMALAQLPVVVILACLLLGTASATSNTTGMATMAGVATEERRGSAMALYSGALLVGQAVGPALGGLLASLGDWRTAMGVGAVLALLLAGAAGLAARHTAARRGGAPRRADPVPEPPLTGRQHLALFAVGFAVFFTVSSMPQVLIPLLGANELGLQAGAIGLALGAGGLARFAGAVSTGVVSDRLSRRAALLPCLAIQAGGVAMLTLVDGVGWWLAAVLAMSLGSSAQSVGATMLGDRSDPRELGRVLGRYRFAGDIGLVTGPVLVAFAYEHIGPDVAALGTCAVLVIALVMSVLLLPETGSRAGR